MQISRSTHSQSALGHVFRHSLQPLEPLACSRPSPTMRTANTDSDTAGFRRASPESGCQLSSKSGFTRASQHGPPTQPSQLATDMHCTTPESRMPTDSWQCTPETTAPPDQSEGTHTVQLLSRLAEHLSILHQVSLAHQAGGLLRVTA